MNHLNLEEFERKIAYTFSDKNLLILALTHSSYANETKKGSHENNERLEFLGDAVLDMVVSEYMYRHFPKMPEGELTKLRAAVESAIHEGMEHFICGMAEGCDLYFAETVLALKKHYPHVTLEAAIPCPTQADGWSEAQRSRYREILRRCDYETMVQQSYTPGCMQRRNRYMVDHASLLIAVNDGLRGGTRSTIEYAFRRGVSVLDIPLA